MKLLFDEGLSPQLIHLLGDLFPESESAEHPDSRIVILNACNYPTFVAAEVLRRNAIRIVNLRKSRERVIILSR